MSLIDRNNNVCMCDDNFYKTCKVRISNNLNCKKSIIRITHLESEPTNDNYDSSINSLDKRLRNIRSSFKETIEHLGKLG